MRGICPREPCGYFKKGEEEKVSFAFRFDSLQRLQKTEVAQLFLTTGGALNLLALYLHTLTKPNGINGAGEGNRTLISGLGSPHSTTEPHPPPLL